MSVGQIFLRGIHKCRLDWETIMNFSEKKTEEFRSDNKILWHFFAYQQSMRNVVH